MKWLDLSVGVLATFVLTCFYGRVVDATPPAGREYQDYSDPEYDEKKERKLDNRLRGEWRGRQQVASYSQQVDATPPAGRDYRGDAELHHRLRGECFDKAQDAYRRGLGQDASFYSQQEVKPNLLEMLSSQDLPMEKMLELMDGDIIVFQKDEHDLDQYELPTAKDYFRRLEAQKRLERKEAHLYMNIQVVTEDYFYGHQGTDLFDQDRANYRNFKVKKTATLGDFLEMLSENLKYPAHQLRPWPFEGRQNQTFRPTLLDVELDHQKTIQEIADDGSWTVFVETVSSESNQARLPHFDKDSDVLLFLKMYDPRTKSMSYCGHAYVPISAKGSELLPELNRRAGFPSNTPLILYEEVKPNLLEMLSSQDLPMEKMLEELMDGDIIVFQKDEHDLDQYELPTAKDYFRDLYYRVEIVFCDKNVINDPGFTLELSLRMNYDHMANAIAKYLGTDPYLLQFFKPRGYREGPGNPIRCTYEGSLKELLQYSKPRQQKKLYFQQLNIRINELENKRQFKCLYVNNRLKEEKELVLYPDKTGRVSDLLLEARKQLSGPNDVGKLRLLEVIGCKIYSIQLEDMSLEMLNSTGTIKTLRVEEIPQEELNLSEEESLIHVAHFHKEVFSTFGVPFLLKIKNHEPFASVKDRIQQKIDVPEKEFEKYKFAVIVMGKLEYISDDDQDLKVNISQFLPHSLGGNLWARPWLGLDHVNKTPKRSRVGNYLEKSIKIHN